jgi:hypothetical protein
MCVKADYTSPVDPMTSVAQTGDGIQEPAIVAAANEETSFVQEVAPQQKCAKIHDFCLGIPFGIIPIPTSFLANCYTLIRVLPPYTSSHYLNLPQM